MQCAFNFIFYFIFFFSYFIVGYYDEGFLAIQFAIDRGIADYMNGKEIDCKLFILLIDFILI